MSIFKETLEDSIQTQLRARTLIVRGYNDDNPNNITRDNRSGLLPWYLSKNAWVKMSSFTDYNDGPVIFKGNGTVVTDTTKGNYKGNELGKKYVLFGGSLYFKSGSSITEETLRFGVATPEAVYGGNIDKAGRSGVNHPYFRQMGIRPMPGITGVSLRTLGAYGSVFETTVKFHCWDTHQLNELELLYMRPGFSVLLEWGWSQYLNYDDNLVNSKSSLREDQIKTQSYIGKTIDPFDVTLTQDTVYTQLEKLRKDYRHNYDGMLGYVKNFNWKLRRDGGYDCETVLISMGESINTIKMSNNSNVLNNKSSINLTSLGSTYVYDDYENILLSLKSNVEGIISYTSGSTTFNTLAETTYSGSWNYDLNYVDTGSIKTKLINSKYPDQATKLDTQPYYKPIISDVGGDNYVGNAYEYITVDVWLAIIGSYCNLKVVNKTGNISFITKLDVPKDIDYCLAGRDSFSVDPSVCMVKNEGAFAKEFEELYITTQASKYQKTSGINPPIISYDGQDVYNDPNLQFYSSVTTNGKIKNILLNIDTLLATYRSMKSSADDSGVNMVDYIKSVMSKVSNSLGGLNNFIVSTAGRNQNIAKIVDTYYLNRQPKDTFYEFDLLGLGSICKNVDIQSQIFENQSTIIGIAAQSRANLGDVYNSSQVYLNAGLTDRLATTKGQGEEIQPLSNQYWQNNENSALYRKILQLMVYARNYVVGNGNPRTRMSVGGTTTLRTGQWDYVINTTSGAGETPSTLLKQSLLRLDGELGFKALIPFKLRITLEGIGGIVVGQIFRIKQNVIPKNYYDKSLGFVITQINHELNNNQWETTLETQICILEDIKGDEFIKQDRKGFSTTVNRFKALAILYPIMVDFVKFQICKSLTGYLFASSEAGNTSLTDDLATESLNDHLFGGNFNNGDWVTKYWANNNKLFLDSNFTSATSNQNSFPLYEFRYFLQNWILTYKSQATTADLQKKVSKASNETLENVLDFIAGLGGTGGYTSTDPVYEGLNDAYINQFEGFLVRNYEYYYPNLKKSFYQSGGTINIDQVITKTTLNLAGTSIDYFTLNNASVNNLVREFIYGAVDNRGDLFLRDVVDGYEARFDVSGRLLNELFFPDSYVMYGRTESLGNTQYNYLSPSVTAGGTIAGTITNNQNHIWQIQQNTITNGATNTLFSFAKRINWSNSNIVSLANRNNVTGFLNDYAHYR